MITFRLLSVLKNLKDKLILWKRKGKERKGKLTFCVHLFEIRILQENKKLVVNFTKKKKKNYEFF